MGLPACADLAAFENDVVDRATRKAAAHRKSGLAGANDRDVGRVHETLRHLGGDPVFMPGRRKCRAYWTEFMATDTGTPFLRTSNTAERARAWSRICCSFSGGASPSISKRIEMLL